VINLNASNIKTGNLTADLIKTGTFDISKVNVENFSANNIVAGTISGKDLSINLDTGAVSFESGVIKNNANTFGINIDTGTIISISDLGTMNINNADISYWGGTDATTWQGEISLNRSVIDAKYPSILLQAADTVILDPGNGNTIKDGIARYYGSSRFGKAFIELGTSSKLSDTGYKENTAGNPAGLVYSAYEEGVTDPNDALTSVLIDPYASWEFALPDTYTPKAGGHNQPAFGSKPLIEVYGGGMYLNGSMQIYGDFSVNGAKQSVQTTRDGVRGLIAYETAESYFGDIGEDTTGNDCKVTVHIDTLFRDTVNTSFPYQVFIVPYGKGNVWVSARKSDHFVVESSFPNTSFGWEIKARRRGDESTRLPKSDIMFKQLQKMDEKHMENEVKENKDGE